MALEVIVWLLLEIPQWNRSLQYTVTGFHYGIVVVGRRYNDSLSLVSSLCGVCQSRSSCELTSNYHIYHWTVSRVHITNLHVTLPTSTRNVQTAFSWSPKPFSACSASCTAKNRAPGEVCHVTTSSCLMKTWGLVRTGHKKNLFFFSRLSSLRERKRAISSLPLIFLCQILLLYKYDTCSPSV